MTPPAADTSRRRPTKTTKTTKATKPVKATKTPAKPKATKPAAKKTVAKKAPSVQQLVPAQRAPEPPAAPAPVVRRPRPLIAVVTRRDGRPVSRAERLEEAMHRRLGHKGPVCHRCRMNGSQLARLAQLA